MYLISDIHVRPFSLLIFLDDNIHRLSCSKAHVFVWDQIQSHLNVTTGKLCKCSFKIHSCSNGLVSFAFQSTVFQLRCSSLHSFSPSLYIRPPSEILIRQSRILHLTTVTIFLSYMYHDFFDTLAFIEHQ